MGNGVQVGKWGEVGNGVEVGNEVEGGNEAEGGNEVGLAGKGEAGNRLKNTTA